VSGKARVTWHWRDGATAATPTTMKDAIRTAQTEVRATVVV